METIVYWNTIWIMEKEIGKYYLGCRVRVSGLTLNPKPQDHGDGWYSKLLLLPSVLLLQVFEDQASRILGFRVLDRLKCLGLGGIFGSSPLYLQVQGMCNALLFLPS